MKFRQLGSSGLKVSAIGLGCMPLSVRSARPSESDAVAVIEYAVKNCGINFIDTADVYCQDENEIGHNERLVGKAVRQLPQSLRQNLVLATKGGMIRPRGQWLRDGSPTHLRAACEASLKALGVERIDLYQYHRIDPLIPLADSIGEFKRLRDEGKIAHVGVSNFSVDEIDIAARIVPIVSVQNEYSPRFRVPEQPVSNADPKLDPNPAGTLDAARQRGIAFIPWSPLGGMSRAGAVAGETADPARIAADHRSSVQRIALAWLLAKGPHVIPIPGASRIASIEDSASAADLQLSAAEISRLDRAWA